MAAANTVTPPQGTPETYTIGDAPSTPNTSAPNPTAAVTPASASGGFTIGDAPPQASMASQAATTAADVGAGFLKGAGQTGQSIVNATDWVGNKIGDALGLPGHASAQDMVGNAPPGTGKKAMEDLTTPKNTAQKVGVGAEGVAEFFLGDEALKGLSLLEKSAKLTKLAGVLEDSPKLAKALDIGMNAIRSGTVSGVEGVAHGETVKEAAGQAALTGGIGAAGELVATTAKVLRANKLAPLAKPVADQMVQIEEAFRTKNTEAAIAGLKEIADSPQLDSLRKNIAALGLDAGQAVLKQLPRLAAAAVLSAGWSKLADKANLPDWAKEMGYVGLGTYGLHGMQLGSEAERAMLNLQIKALPMVAKTATAVSKVGQGAVAATLPTKPAPVNDDAEMEGAAQGLGGK